MAKLVIDTEKIAEDYARLTEQEQTELEVKKQTIPDVVEERVQAELPALRERITQEVETEVCEEVANKYKAKREFFAPYIQECPDEESEVEE